MRTRYAEKLCDALQEAYRRRERGIELALLNMIAAIKDGRYEDLPKLWVTLPERYRAILGSPPADQEDDPPP